MSKITVLGSGGWGTALALTAFHCKHEVTVWSPFESEINMLKNDREHKKLLPGVIIPDEINFTTDIEAVNGSLITIIAVPSFAVRETAARLKGKDCGIIVNVAKGIESVSHLRLSEVIADELPGSRVVALSGPSHAEEVGRRVPTTIVAASLDNEAAIQVQSALMCSFFRIYTNSDVMGVELGAALKNIIAVAAGVVDGLGYGDNTKAALITRGLTEIARLGIKMGAKEKTFMGLSGLGDLVVTCTSVHSRNHRFGEMIGHGAEIAKALETVGTVEGYHATATAWELAKELSVDMPITEQCYAVLYEEKDSKDAITNLMGRPGKN
ncbi:MAG: NAD(P)-dependent glycerol-3-phosphate dehydrogenase, partial [Oscillospiraceae bacterium]|nr:NAD(P)-dependent glycerol-3-phosphate dehydrogenase [Oscillospiraceae bacterium]